MRADSIRPKGGSAPANAEETLTRYEIITAFGGSSGIRNRADFQSNPGKLVDLLHLACIAGCLCRRMADGLVGTRLAEKPRKQCAGAASRNASGISNPFNYKTL